MKRSARRSIREAVWKVGSIAAIVIAPHFGAIANATSQPSPPASTKQPSAISTKQSPPAGKRKPVVTRPANPGGVRSASVPASLIATPNSVPLPVLGIDLAPDPFTPSVSVITTNRSKSPVTGRIILSNPDNFLGGARYSQSLLMAPGESVRTKFTLPGAAMAPDSRYAFSAEIELPDVKFSASRLLNFFTIERAAAPPAMDGSMAGWLGASMIVVNIPGRVPGKNGWKGRTDMTATARFLWDADHLYLMLRRTDDIHQPARNPSDRDGDRIRLSISPTGSHLSEASWASFDLVPLVTGAVTLRVSDPKRKIAPGIVAGARLTYTDQNGVGIFTAAIPWKEIGVTKGVKTKRLGLTVRSIDDDGDGARSWLEWGGGADDPADPALFADVSLGD